MALKIPRALYEHLRQHGEATYPHECCGVLMGEFDEAVRITLPTSNLERRAGIEPAYTGFADLRVSRFATGALETVKK